MMNIAVYGSLRKGEYNFARFNLEYQETTTIKGYDLFSLGSYPGIKKSKDLDKELTVDLMTCDNDTFNRINLMEISAGYTPVELTINDTTYTIYEYNHYRSQPTVESGDWCSRKRLD